MGNWPLTPSGGGAVNYSTTPVKTGEKWIDGKDVYRAVLQLSPISASAIESFPLGFQVDSLCSLKGIMYDPNGTIAVLPLAISGFEVSMSVATNRYTGGTYTPNTLIINTAYVRSGASGCFIIDFTKP